MKRDYTEDLPDGQYWLHHGATLFVSIFNHIELNFNYIWYVVWLQPKKPSRINFLTSLYLAPLGITWHVCDFKTNIILQDKRQGRDLTLNDYLLLCGGQALTSSS